MILCACIVVQGENPHLGIVLNTEETLLDFLWKWSNIGLLGHVPMRRPRPEWGRDNKYAYYHTF